MPENATLQTPTPHISKFAPTSRTALRALLIAQRHALSRSDAAQQTAHIHTQLLAHLDAAAALRARNTTDTAYTTISLYAPHAGEPDVLCIAHDIARNYPQIKLALPVVMPKKDGHNQPLQFAQWAAGEPLSADAYGIAVPTVKRWVIPNVVVIPCVGYHTNPDTGKAYRLGYGGGYYDRSLAARRGAGKPVQALGIAWRHSQCVFDPSAHDVAMDEMILG